MSRRKRRLLSALAVVVPAGKKRLSLPSRPERRHWRRALELLAASPNGATEAILVAHGLSIDLLVELIATATTERVMAGGRSMGRSRGCGFTEAGRRVLKPERQHL
jgi:hypothetical protein